MSTSECTMSISNLNLGHGISPDSHNHGGNPHELHAYSPGNLPPGTAIYPCYINAGSPIQPLAGYYPYYFPITMTQPMAPEMPQNFNHAPRGTSTPRKVNTSYKSGTSNTSSGLGSSSKLSEEDAENPEYFCIGKKVYYWQYRLKKTGDAEDAPSMKEWFIEWMPLQDDPKAARAAVCRKLNFASPENSSED